MKKALLLVSAASLLLLQACGGGGGDDAGTSGGGNTNTSTPGGNGGDTGTNPGGNSGGGTGTGGTGQGSVSASFQPGSASRYILVYPGGQSMGPLTDSNSQQADNGAMITLSDNQLTGSYTVQDIAGDANFAIGRWVKGSVVRNGGATDTLTGTNGRAYHYLAYQGVSAFPDNALHCGGGDFTTPTYMDGGSKAATVGTSMTGTADIAFSNGKGALSGSLTVKANGETASVAFPKSLSSPSSMGSTGMGTSGSSASVQLADTGDGAYALAIQLTALMPSGARYIGVGRLTCTSN